MYETQVCSDRYRVTMTSISSRKPDEADERAVTRSSPCSVSPPCAPPQPLSEAEGLLHPCCTGAYRSALLTLESQVHVDVGSRDQALYGEHM